MAALTYVELGRQVVLELAPAELELFDDVTQTWLAGGLVGRRARSMGESLGSGLEPLLASQIVYPVITGALAAVLSDSAMGAWGRLARRWSRWRARRRPPPVVIPDLEPQQLELVRAACFEKALEMGVSRRRASALADAVWGAMERHRSGDSSDEQKASR